jgi:hypothetical protein
MPNRRRAYVWVLSLGLVLGTGPASAASRDLTVMPKVASGSVPITGDYWALLIGIDRYQQPNVPKLQSAVRDAQAVREVLVQRYGFARDKIIELINGQATRRNIEDALYQLRKKAGKNDSVFIYYAGHGQIDQEDQIGYWVPVEGEAQSPGTFISNARIRDEIGRMKARHVYLVADSCFSGTLFASSRSLPPLNDKFFARLYANKSRWGLTSGMNEPVTDQGKDGHSMFAYFFLKLLKENEDPYLVPSRIYDQIAPLIGRNTDQQPRSEPLQNAGDEGGQFVFRLTPPAPPEIARIGPLAGFVFYNGNRFDDPGMRREWTRLEGGAWQERYPNGYVTTLESLGRAVVEGAMGTHLRKLDYPDQEIFVPDKGSGSSRLLWRQTGGNWRYIGDIQDAR